MELNCTLQGDKRFHPSTAYTKLFGQEGTISELYASAKRNKDGSLCIEGNRPDHICVNGRRISPDNLGLFYDTLWYQYLAMNRHLIAEICKYDSFSDGHKSEAYNSQARVFRKIKQNGNLAGLKAECTPFVNMVNSQVINESKTSPITEPKNFNEIIAMACDFARQAKDEQLTREEMLQRIPNHFAVKSFIIDLADAYLDIFNGVSTREYGLKIQTQVRQRYENDCKEATA